MHPSTHFAYIQMAVTLATNLCNLKLVCASHPFSPQNISYFLSYCSTFKPQAASSITGLPKDDLRQLYLHKCFSVTVQPTPIKFGVTIVKILSC